jgi:O-antigen/teichoic acid export membrane protein
VFWGVIERATTQGVSFVVVLLLARLLGPESYGLVALAATIALLGQSLLGETFSQALIQQKALAPAHASSLFWILLGAGLIATVLQIVLADSVAAVFAEPELGPILRALSPLLFIAALQAVPAALFKRELKFRALAAAFVNGTVFGGIAGVALPIRVSVPGASLPICSFRTPSSPHRSGGNRRSGRCWPIRRLAYSSSGPTASILFCCALQHSLPTRVRASL